MTPNEPRERLRLVPAAAPHTGAPALDADQRRVVDHAGGPLLVLAGPGTGKTTTLVESVVHRIDSGTAPERVLALTFSRRAAVDLRRRVTARLGRSVVTPRAMTFHAFCHALVRRFTDPELYGTGVRLLTAPEQEFRLREALTFTERVRWPDGFEAARDTRGFAGEIRSVLARARQLGMDPADLIRAGELAGRPVWSSAGEFFDEYLDVLDAEEVLDYAELVHRSRILLADPAVAAAMRAEIDAVFVDEYQDTDPSQVLLLRSLVGDRGNVVAFGDPDQSIYAFRGANPRGLVDFPAIFHAPDGSPAPVLALGTAHRAGRAIAAATGAVTSRLALPAGLPAEVVLRYRHPVVSDGLPRGRVEAWTYDSPGAEAEHIADLLRRARLHDGVPWAEMAVLVRSGRASLPALSRALTAAGVPVEVAGDEIPLACELAVRPLLLALQVAGRDVALDADEAVRLLTSPLCGLDSMGVRKLGRQLREAERDELAGGDLPRPSPELVRRALETPDLLDDCADSPQVRAARDLSALLHRAAAAIGDGNNAEEVLWTLWSQTSWPERLRAEATGGGDGRANRDLDAICALFDVAARSSDVAGRRGAAAFLAEVEGQQIPADTQRESDLRGGAVRLLTAHRSKGLEWPLVVVAGVQEGLWPDLRRRGTVLEADRLSRNGLAEPEPPSVRLAEERRLFLVACSRATSRLVVTAVNGTEGEDDQPSRFLAELGVRVQPVRGRPRRPLTLTALVGELRRTASDPQAPPGLRQEAGARLARLAAARDDRGRLVTPGADPAHWWGMRELSDAGTSVVGQSLSLSGSQLGSLLACPRNWFLSRKAHGESGRGSAASVGSVVHALVEHSEPETDPDEWALQLDRVWDQIDFDASWMSSVERAEAESALERFQEWQRANHRTLIGREVPFEVDTEVAGGERLRLTGTVDRLERDGDGRLRIVDFKTSRHRPTAAEVAGSDQLGLYQLAATLGAFDELAPGERRVAGAELVYLRLQDGATPYPRVFGQESLDTTGPEWILDHLGEAARLIRQERFEARVNDGCRWCPFQASCPAQRAGEQVVS